MSERLRTARQALASLEAVLQVVRATGVTLEQWREELVMQVDACSAMRDGLQKLAELLRRQAGVPDNSRHGASINGIIARDGEEAAAIGHYDVPALARNVEACLFQCSDGAKVWNAGDADQD